MGLYEFLEIINFEKADQKYNIHLDEKKQLSDDDFRDPNIVARGSTDYVTKQDYPLRGCPVYLHMHKNKWWDKKANGIFPMTLSYLTRRGHDLVPISWLFFKDEG